MMNYTSDDGLSIPLVGTLPHEVSTTPKIRDDTATVMNETEYEDEETSQYYQYQDICISIALSILMFVHFGLIFYIDPDHTIHGLSWTTMNISITLFIVAAYLYRTVLTEYCNVSGDVAMLLPEIVIVVVMTFVFFDHIIVAFLVLSFGKFTMATTVVVINTYRLWFEKSIDNDDEQAKDGQPTSNDDAMACVV
jgi:hypothetical protein